MNITTIAQRLSLLVLLVAAPLSAALAAQATPAPPQLAAKSYVLLDAASGKVRRGLFWRLTTRCGR